MEGSTVAEKIEGKEKVSRKEEFLAEERVLEEKRRGVGNFIEIPRQCFKQIAKRLRIDRDPCT